MILKKLLRFTVITTLCLVVAMFFVAVSCEKQETPLATCSFENPLTDLPWLKAEVDEIILTIQNGNPLSVSIYQCIYGNGETGFLVDQGNIKPFYSCDGEVLCIMGGVAGETCPQLNIVSKELIWKI